MRQGENVDGLDWLRARVHILLSDRRCSRETAHVQGDVGMDEWHGLVETRER